jgi:hypothetical protein
VARDIPDATPSAGWPGHPGARQPLGDAALQGEAQHVPERVMVGVSNAFQLREQVDAEQLIVAQPDRDRRSVRKRSHAGLRFPSLSGCGRWRDPTPNAPEQGYLRGSASVCESRAVVSGRFEGGFAERCR